MKRRTYLTTASATASIGIAGCTGYDFFGGEDTEADDNETDENDTEPDGNDTEPDDDTDDVDDDLPELVGTFDDFEDLSVWEPVVGSVRADGGRASTGSQSARLLSPASENQARIMRELSEPIDVEEVVPGLALSTESSASPVIQLYDDTGDYFQYHQYITETHPFVRQNFGHTFVSGDPDLNEITEIQILFWTGEDSEGELWVDDLHFVPRVDTGRVLLQFQGGYETDYTQAFPVLDAYDLPGSTFVATSRIRVSENSEGTRMTESQLDELMQAGWSIGTVGARGLHLNRVDPDEVESDILNPLEWLDEFGYGDARYFAFPGGRYSEEMYELVSENYDLGFAGRYHSQGWASNPYGMTRISGGAGRRNLTAEQMIEALDWTAEYGGITTIVFYEMDDEDAEALDATAAHLTDLLSAGDLELITPGEIADEYVL